MKQFYDIPSLLIFLLLLFPLARPASGSSVVPPQNLGELALMSEGIVLARAGKGTPKRGGTLIFTHTRFTVLEIVGGNFRVGEQIDVEAYGGQMDGLGFAVPGSPEFEAGEVYLLFLSPKGDGWQPRMMSYGLLQEVTDPNGNRVLTHLEELHDVELIARKDGVTPEPI
ncbi:MAG: hypothetical protein R3268_08140, partial [Acidiferrobacterales bacterium]|nr:hypothetical protein [Acidiferrobacterales bacterium]